MCQRDQHFSDLHSTLCRTMYVAVICAEKYSRSYLEELGASLLHVNHARVVMLEIISYVRLEFLQLVP